MSEQLDIEQPELEAWIFDCSLEGCAFVLRTEQDLLGPGLSMQFLIAYDMAGNEHAVYTLTPNQVLMLPTLLPGAHTED